MARRNRSAADTSTRAPEIHTPSSPSRPPVICIYAWRSDKCLIVSWATIHGAASFIEALVDQEDDQTAYRYVKSEAPTRRVGIVYESGLRIEADTEAGLEAALDYEVTWELAEPYRSQVKQFLSDHVLEPDDRSTEGRAARKKAPRGERTPVERKPKGPGVPAGYLHVSAILPDVEPAHARAALRKLGWAKPAYGWSFDPAETKKVATAIKGALK